MTPKVSSIAVFIKMNVEPEMIDVNYEKNIDIIAKLDKMDNEIAEVNQKLTSLQNQVNQVNQNIKIEFNTLREQVTQIQNHVRYVHTNTPQLCTIL